MKIEMRAREKSKGKVVTYTVPMQPLDNNWTPRLRFPTDQEVIEYRWGWNANYQILNTNATMIGGA
jgi:hypothetical protein